MKNAFDRLFKMSILSWIVFIILGLFLYLKAELTLRVISYIIGITLVITGLIPIIKALASKDKNYSSYILISSIFIVIAGLIICINTELIASIIPLLIGIILVINGISKIKFSFLLKDSNISKWYISLITSIIITVLGIFFVLNPFSTAVVATQIIGIIIIVYSIADMIEFVVLKKQVDNVTDTFNKMVDVKIIDENDN